MAVKIKPADTWFSKCVRESSAWTCQKCGSVHEQGSQGLHCSHNFSRRHRTIRWCKDNALALCFGCHQWFGGNPYESGKWLENRIGEGTITLLLEKKESHTKVSKLEEKDIAAHYKKEHQKLLDARNEGWQGNDGL